MATNAWPTAVLATMRVHRHADRTIHVVLKIPHA